MTKPTVVTYNRISTPAIEDMKKDYDVRTFTNFETTKDPAFRAALQEAEAIMNVDLEVDDQLLAYAPNVKIVSNVSVGYDNLDVEALQKRGIYATHTPGILTETTADAIFGLLLSTARRIPELDHYVKTGAWNEMLPEAKFGVDVHHKTLGMIGMGRIGEAIARRAHFGFQMNIQYYNRSQKEEVEQTLDATRLSLDELLETSDFICIMVPLTEDTKHLIDASAFKKMTPSAIFINGSRGSTVDEKALIEALNQGEILAAGLDVFEEEPLPEGHPFLQMEQVVTTPHIGSSTHENEENMARLAAEDIKLALAGKEPKHRIQPS
ncbi:2-hydroxyacid dehydrogenase [Salsuginibacillus kocurii]|uniref:2-hydroxyacid dehydrogenase n=1 Tax=Salsuginibacillus kocurii TaxID=427078 RepID=UPI00037DF6BC|nr:D-glycerate dehydrogenase [Salsuginibacillus kocurii]